MVRSIGVWIGILNYLGVLTAGLSGAQAAEVVKVADPALLAELPASPVATDLLDSEVEPTDAMSQVTSVSQLTDVQPSDWAFQALQTLVERYGVIVGYPDRTFRGNRSLSRYEFAAALSQFLQNVDRVLAAEQGERVFQREDLGTLRRLAAQFGGILQEVEERLDGLEARTGELEANQFSTTTKLQGQAILAFTAGSRANSTVIARVRLNFLTSFAPNDLLRTELETGNNGLDAIGYAHSQGENLLGTLGLLADGGGLEYVAYGSSINLRSLHYTFQPRRDLALTIGPRMMVRDFIDRNSYANDAATNFNSSFFINNPLIVQNQIDRSSGAGAAVSWNVGSGPLTLRGLYIAANGNNSMRDSGLFNGNQYQASAEVEYRVNSAIAVRLQYTNASINQTTVQAGGLNAEWAFNRKLAVFGRYGFGTYRGFNPVLARNLDLSPQTWALGVTLRDFGIPGSSAGFAVGQPFIEGKIGDATQTNYELFYNLLLNDNLSISPSFMVVDNPNNLTNVTIWQGTLRTVFSF